MTRVRSRLLAVALLSALCACGAQPDGDPAVSPDGTGPGAGSPGNEALPAAVPADQDAAAAVPAPGSDQLLDRAGAPVPLVAFDPGTVSPAATAPGALPVFSLPRGYMAIEGPRVRAHARFPFRLGNGLHWVEGPSWSSRIGVDKDAFPDKQFSPLELRRNLEAVLEQAGARRVYDGPLQRDMYYGTLDEEIGGGFIDVVNRDEDTPTQVFVIRHAERTVWIQLVLDTHDTGVVAVDETPFQATSRWSDVFPHLSLPAGYERRNRGLQRDYDAFPFWTGTAFEEVEGKAYAVGFDAGRNTTSMYEVRRNLEAMMAEAGGVLVHAGAVPKEQAATITADRISSYSDAAGYSWDEDERSTWRVELDGGRQVWIHARLDSRAAGWVVVEREGFQQTSALLAADAMQKAIADDGRVAIAVNFAVDKADILPESQPQLDQVAALLRADDTLRLWVDGHTDGSGDATRNRTLSTARAASVVASLVAAGIAADRLESRGFGADRPLADNATDAGKARNRRVELVKR